MKHDDYKKAIYAPEFAMVLGAAAMMGLWGPGAALFMYWSFLKGSR